MYLEQFPLVILAYHRVKHAAALGTLSWCDSNMAGCGCCCCCCFTHFIFRWCCVVFLVAQLFLDMAIRNQPLTLIMCIDQCNLIVIGINIVWLHTRTHSHIMCINICINWSHVPVEFVYLSLIFSKQHTFQLFRFLLQEKPLKFSIKSFLNCCWSAFWFYFHRSFRGCFLLFGSFVSHSNILNFISVYLLSRLSTRETIE